MENNEQTNKYAVDFDNMSTKEKYNAAGVKPTFTGNGIDIGLGVFGERNAHLKRKFIEKKQAQASFLDQQGSSFMGLMDQNLAQSQNEEDVSQLNSVQALYNLGVGLLDNGDSRGATYMAEAVKALNSHAGTQETQRLGREAALKAQQLTMGKQINVESDKLNEQFRKQMTPLREASRSMSLIDELSTAESPLAQKMIITKVARLMQGSGVLSDSDIRAVSGATGTFLESIDQMVASGVDGSGMTPESRNGIIRALQPMAQKIETAAAAKLEEFDSVAGARGLDKSRVFAGVDLKDFESYKFTESTPRTLEEVATQKQESAQSLRDTGSEVGEKVIDLVSGFGLGIADSTGIRKGIDGIVDYFAPESVKPILNDDKILVEQRTRAAARRKYQNARSQRGNK